MSPNYLSDLADSLSRKTGKQHEDLYRELKANGVECVETVSRTDYVAYARVAQKYGITDEDIASTISNLSGISLETVYQETRRPADYHTRLAEEHDALSRKSSPSRSSLLPRIMSRRAMGFPMFIVAGIVVFAIIIVLLWLRAGESVAPFVYTLF